MCLATVVRLYALLSDPLPSNHNHGDIAGLANERQEVSRLQETATKLRSEKDVLMHKLVQLQDTLQSQELEAQHRETGGSEVVCANP